MFKQYVFLYVKNLKILKSLDTTQHTKTENNTTRATGSSEGLHTSTDPKTAGYSEHIYCKNT